MNNRAQHTTAVLNFLNSAEEFFEIDCFDDELKRQTIIDVVYLLLPFYETEYKGDTKPRDLINRLREYVDNKTSIDVLKALRGSCANSSRHKAYEAASYGNYICSHNKSRLWKAYFSVTAIIGAADAIAASKGHHICSALVEPSSYLSVVRITKELVSDSLL